MQHNRHIIAVLSIVMTAAAVAAPPVPQDTYMSDGAAARFLDQATWGPTPQSIVILKEMGLRQWFDWQFTSWDSDLPDQPLLNAAGNANTTT